MMLTRALLVVVLFFVLAPPIVCRLRLSFPYWTEHNFARSCCYYLAFDLLQL